MAEWQVDPLALSRAELRLGLRHGVRVSIRNLREDAGRYNGVRDRLHQITLDNQQCVWQAGVALWHELTHAQQLEQEGEDFWPSYRECCEDYEDKARSNELLNHLIPLCKPC